ncbi:MAG: response regulator [Leptothrix sp. (in: b-proteobacteria)]
MAARILVIEDNEANLELVQYLLEKAGYEVLTARDGAQGATVALQGQPALIICDLQMPVMDGYQVLATLRQEPATCTTTVIAVTAFSMPGDQQKVLVAGFDGYLAKPIEPENFVAQIEAFLPAERRSRPTAPGA